MGGDLVNVPGWAGAKPMVPASPAPTGRILPQKRDFPTTAADQFRPVFHRGRAIFVIWILELFSPIFTQRDVVNAAS